MKIKQHEVYAIIHRPTKQVYVGETEYTGEYRMSKHLHDATARPDRLADRLEFLRSVPHEELELKILDRGVTDRKERKRIEKDHAKWYKSQGWTVHNRNGMMGAQDPRKRKITTVLSAEEARKFEDLVGHGNMGPTLAEYARELIA